MTLLTSANESSANTPKSIVEGADGAENSLFGFDDKAVELRWQCSGLEVALHCNE